MNTSWNEHSVPELHTLKGKRVLIRVDWNMPVQDGKIVDLSRFDATTPFIQKLIAVGAKIILMTHFGEKGGTLQPVAEHATKTFPSITFTPSFDLTELHALSNTLKEGEGMLLENVRLFPGETENDPSLAEAFSSLGDVFINDAFSVSHRKHASVVGVATRKLSYFGPTCMRELEHLSRILDPVQPALLIVGGAKISTKISLIKRYLDKGVKVFVGGAMVHNIWKEKGIEIGKSLYDSTYKLPEGFSNHPLLLTPVDVVLSSGETVEVTKVPKEEMIVDCGKKTAEMLHGIITLSNTVIANGPLGLYEKGWLHGSELILTDLAHAKVASYIGGGDTVTVANSLHLLNNFTFVSLGGGAMLDFLSSGTLPGIDAVTK